MSRLTDDVQSAFDFALRYHRYQTRSNGVLPYVSHCLEVVKLLLNWGIEDSRTLEVAMLHDTAEDSNDPNETLEDIEAEFGSLVAGCVKELTYTKRDGYTKDDYMKSFITASPLAIVVKMADRICNTQDFHESGDHWYAKRYFAKAAPLWDAFNAKHNDILEAYGTDTHSQIINLWLFMGGE